MIVRALPHTHRAHLESPPSRAAHRSRRVRSCPASPPPQLPDDYIKKMADAVHQVGGLMVLDCIASGTVWVDMEKCGVDALISAPQKGWTGPSCAGLVMLSERGADVARASRGSSFVCDLRKWLELMDSYEAGGFMYHATMPTDALVTFRDVMLETKTFGFDQARDNAWKVGADAHTLHACTTPRPATHASFSRDVCEFGFAVRACLQLGNMVRSMMCEEKGLISVAAPGFEAPGVVVVHTSDASVAGKFIKAGTQIAAGVPFMIGEPSDTKTFRIGLFGLDKLINPTKTATILRGALDQAVPEEVVRNLSGYIRTDTALKKAMPSS